ncbi:hypothetical protein T4B_1416 [Trichinella pseudospiralis]|uniref:Uncharacterized protein n=2 Tax=Trichinella pseudospiralis TaxID=6337 RepID=A0A0V1FZ69_TRIPS|nr:hypothetical protein T4D_1273 [Trichinella pseudospiralis]KRZ33768.1 hypothetical protein T4B_1416 [Trichinella pseudospiralis]
MKNLFQSKWLDWKVDIMPGGFVILFSKTGNIETKRFIEIVVEWVGSQLRRCCWRSRISMQDSPMIESDPSCTPYTFTAWSCQVSQPCHDQAPKCRHQTFEAPLYNGMTHPDIVISKTDA